MRLLVCYMCIASLHNRFACIRIANANVTDEGYRDGLVVRMVILIIHTSI